MTDRPRLYRRWCRGCRRLDDAVPLVAGSHADGEATLLAEAWTCPRCGGADYDVCTPYREGDLDPANVPPFPIDTARVMRGEQD